MLCECVGRGFRASFDARGHPQGLVSLWDRLDGNVVMHEAPSCLEVSSPDCEGWVTLKTKGRLVKRYAIRNGTHHRPFRTHSTTWIRHQKRKSAESALCSITPTQWRPRTQWDPPQRSVRRPSLTASRPPTVKRAHLLFYESPEGHRPLAAHSVRRARLSSKVNFPTAFWACFAQ
jgi:hypothetical protein